MNTPRHFNFPVNIHGKDKQWNWETLATGFEDRKGTIDDIMGGVKSGHALCAGLLGGKRRSKANVIGSEWVLLDIDNSDTLKDENGKPVLGEDGKAVKVYSKQLTLDEAIAHPFVQKHCSLIYTTASHKPDWHKFRLVFLLPQYVEGSEAVEAMVRMLMEHFPHDPACKDASRVFFGSTAATFPHINRDACLPADWLDRAIALANQEKERKQVQLAGLAIKREQFRQLANDEGGNTDELIQQALPFIPPRSLGSGNYEESCQVVMALVDHYGSTEGAAIAEKWSPSIRGTSWNITQKVRSFRRGGITIGTLFHIAESYGFKFPKRTVEQKDPREPNSQEYEAFCRQQQEQERVEALQALEQPSKRDRWIDAIKRKFTRSRDREASRGAIALERKIQPLIADDVYEYEPGQRLLLTEKLVKAGTRYILDRSGTGSGKSHDCGLAQPESLGVEKIMYVTNDVRNPTVETLQDNWHAVPARHEGITLDSNGKQRRAKPGDVLLTEANCIRIPAINTLRAKNVSGADGDVVCQSCPMLQACKSSSDLYKHQRRIAIQQKLLRIHLASLPDSSDFNYSRCGAFVEESDETLKVVKNLTVTLADVDRAIVTIVSHPDLALRLQAFLLALRALLLGKQERFGIGLKELRECLPKLADLDYDLLYDALRPDLSGLEPPDGVTIEGNEDQALTDLKNRYTADQDELKRLEQLDLAAAIAGIVNKAAIQARYKERRSNLKRDYEAESKRLRDVNSRAIKKINLSLRFGTAQGSEETRQILERDVQKQWLPEFLGILAGDRGFARIVKGELILSLPDLRTIEALKQMKFVMFLSATESVENLALKLGCKPSDIAVVRQRSPKVDNLKITQVMDLGRLGMQRGEDKHRRAMAIADFYKEQDPANTKVIDFKRFADEDTGVWWRDSRGSNDFQTAKTLVLVGTPCRNIGEQLSEYAILTGVCDVEDEGFKAYVDHQIGSDFQQAIGRLRANRRPDEQLEIILLSDFDLGIATEKIKSCEIAIYAGSKNERFIHAVKVAASQLKESGQKITQTAIAKLTSYSQQYISKFWKLLLSLLEIPYRKSSKKSPGADDPESSELIDAHCQVLEAVASEQSSPDLLESLCDVFLNGLPESLWQDCLHQLSSRAQQSILAALMYGLPPDDIAELEAIA